MKIKKMAQIRRRDAMEHVYISHGIMKEYYDQCDGSIINDVYINMPKKKSIKIETPTPPTTFQTIQ